VAPALPARADAAAATGPSFLQRVDEGLQAVNQQILTSQSDLQHLAVGDASSLHQVMVRLEESRISLQLLLQVRNRVLEAYQDVMRMQI
jgi:flagellar hook-basal body complex protein FliE